MAYSPYRRFGHCPTPQELSQDNEIGILHTNRIRLYSTECHHLNDVYLAAASGSSPKFAQVELLLGLWIDGNPARDAQEIQDLYLYLRKYPHARLSGIAVGNEVLYRRTMHPDVLAQKVSEVKATVRRQYYKKAQNSALLCGSRYVKLPVRQGVQVCKEFQYCQLMLFLTLLSLLSPTQ